MSLCPVRDKQIKIERTNWIYMAVNLLYNADLLFLYGLLTYIFKTSIFPLIIIHKNSTMSSLKQNKTIEVFLSLDKTLHRSLYEEARPVFES